jgi:hypothetical protein
MSFCDDNCVCTMYIWVDDGELAVFLPTSALLTLSVSLPLRDSFIQIFNLLNWDSTFTLGSDAQSNSLDSFQWLGVQMSGISNGSLEGKVKY